jgi:hypothetical protein
LPPRPRFQGEGRCSQTSRSNTFISLKTPQPASSSNLSRALLIGGGFAREFGLFLLFVAAYCVPLMLDNAASLRFADPRIRELLGELLARPGVREEIARNSLGHLVLLTPVFLLLSALARQLAAVANISVWTMRLIILLASWVFLIAANAVAFPKSDYSVPFAALARPELAYVLGALLGIGCIYILYRAFVIRRRTVIVGGLIAGGLFASGFGLVQWRGHAEASGRNVIIVGVDSMSAVAFAKLEQSLPNLSQLMDSGVSYQRAYTPLGRTFPAWVSILSGQSPLDHGAIFNLRSMDQVEKKRLISSELLARGYRTVYAIDERRFNNIDQAFGFQKVVGPSAGGLDFILQRLNDTPLSNLLVQTRLGKLLMPFTYTNVASHSNYDAMGFVDSVLDAVGGDGPLFLAVHFESAHFPYTTRHALQKFTGPNPYWNSQAAALTVVDRQVGRLMAGLARRGSLDDALVIVLSDHGEGLGELEASPKVDGVPTPIQVYGHGADLLSDHENHIVLGVIRFKGGRPGSQAVDARQVSLLDLKPLISRYVDGGDTSLVPSEPCLLVETDLRLAGSEDYRTLNEADLAANSAGYYEIDPAGRLRLREGRMRELAATKDVGVRCRDRVTYLSAPRQRYYTISLDEAGLPHAQLPLNGSDVQQIESYRSRLERTLPAPSSGR